MRILGISGSLRRGSHNRKLLRAAAAALPPGVDLVEWDGLADLPAFDEDQEKTPAEPVRALLDLIASADALLIATPEYNASLPGALKNALDWASRPFPSSVLRCKPSAVIGASTGPFGAVWAQAELRKSLTASGAHVVDAELPVGTAAGAFAADGSLADPTLSERLRRLLGELAPRGLTHPKNRSIRGPDRVPMTMHAVGYRENLDVGDRASLVEVTMPVPVPGPHDLLVRVRAVSVNPIDTKIRRGSPVAGGAVRILGFDAAGTVEAIGPEVTRFGVGDDVYYAGVTNRPGSNAEFQVVDEHIVGRKPATLDFAQSAALPLTTITAWEGLFDHLGLTPDSSGTLVAVAAAGGVGSMVTQLARTQTGLTVIATASRPESARFAATLGAHHVVNHHNGLAGHVLAIAPDGVDHVFSPYSPQHIDAYARALRPLGHVVCIDAAPDLGPIRHKSITWHSELIFTRPLFLPTDDSQHRLLNQAAALVDAGVLRTTATEVLDRMDAATLRQAHRMVETTAMVGKVVINA